MRGLRSSPHGDLDLAEQQSANACRYDGRTRRAELESCRLHRTVEVAFIAKGKSPEAIAVLKATLWGVAALITISLNIVLVTSLLIAQLLAGILQAVTLDKSLFVSMDNSRME